MSSAGSLIACWSLLIFECSREYFFLLIAHKIFWQFPENPRFESTITELIYVPDEIKDGQYLLNLQFVPFQNDASPSRPVLFKLEKNHNENG